MGLRVQLGHVNLTCLLPQPGHKDFTVLHTNGLHYVAVDFCGCDQRVISNWQQLLQAEWFPVTIHQPQTSTTFRLLELFHVITLSGKLSSHKFYRALEYLTNNTELEIPKVGLVCTVRSVLITPPRIPTRLPESSRIPTGFQKNFQKSIFTYFYISLLLDSHWTPTGLPLDFHWTPTGLLLDSNWTPTEFEQNTRK